MTVTINNNYPIFEADQVLTADHLNDAFDYLEEQERLTRVKLIGMGIVCGLNVSLNEGGDTISISNGVGITSKGYLITMKGDPPSGLSNYSFYTPYEDPNEDDYPFFLDAVGNPIPLFELQQQNIQGAEPFSELPDPITDYGVVLFLECLDKRLKNCIENDCNEKGTERIFTLRVLLVRKEDLRYIICLEESLSGPKTEAQLEELINARFQLDGLQIPRIKLSPNIVSAAELFNVYQNLIDSALPLVQNALLGSYDYFEPILAECYQGVGNFRQTVNVTLKNLREAIGLGNRCRSQYFYYLLCDLVETYNEFIDKAFDLWTACCPSLAPFPKHLRLDCLRTNNNACEPSVYRTRFLSSPILKNQEILSFWVKHLHLKLFYLIQNYQGGSNLQQIRITPSRALDEPLYERAIPAYYQPTLAIVRHWNPGFYRKCRSQENLSYHASAYATGPNYDHIRNPLGYSLKKCGFLRIEGHLCLPYRVALDSILTIRRNQSLPFDIVALKVGTNADGTTVENLTCHAQDLETICEAWKKEMECLLGRTLGGITSFNPGNVFTAPTDPGDPGFVLPQYPGIDPNISILDNVISFANNMEGFFGSFVVETFDRDNEDPCENSDQVISVIQNNYDFSHLTNTEYQIAIQYPAEISMHTLDFARAIDQTCADLDIGALELAQNRLLRRVQEYNNLLNTYTPSPDRTFNFDRNFMIRIMSMLVGACSLERIKVIKAEMDRRAAELLNMNLFSEYIGKHPGLDQAGGVPKGGTFVIAYAGEPRNTNDPPEGTVIGDFYLPYLCCSDCPPICYILPDEGIAPTLTIPNDRFCLPFGGESIPFTVTPEDGEVTGEGVVIDDNGNYLFDPNSVNMGTDNFRELIFQVNGQAVSLVILLELTPSIEIESEVFWEPVGGVLLPFLRLNNPAFNSYYNYQWQVNYIDEDGNPATVPGSPFDGDQAEIQVSLNGVNRQSVLEIILTAEGRFCTNAGSQEQEFTPPTPTGNATLEIFGPQFEPVTVSTFFNGDQRNYFFRGTPANGDLEMDAGDSDLTVADFIDEKLPQDSHTDYRWTPLEKPQGQYNFIYQHPNGGSASRTIFIQGNDPFGSPGAFLNEAVKVNDQLEVIRTADLFAELLDDSVAFNNTVAVNKRLINDWQTATNFQAYRAGNQDERFAEELDKAVEDTSKKIVESRDNTTARDYLLGLFKVQVEMAINFTAMREGDLSGQNPVSKLFTVLNNQIKKMKERGVPVEEKLKFEDLLATLAPALEGKAKAKKKIDNILEQL